MLETSHQDKSISDANVCEKQKFFEEKSNIHRKSMKIQGGCYTPCFLYPEKYSSFVLPNLSLWEH